MVKPHMFISQITYAIQFIPERLTRKAVVYFSDLVGGISNVGATDYISAFAFC